MNEKSQRQIETTAAVSFVASIGASGLVAMQTGRNKDKETHEQMSSFPALLLLQAMEWSEGRSHLAARWRCDDKPKMIWKKQEFSVKVHVDAAPID